MMHAVRCSVEVYEELQIENADLLDKHSMEFRIGVYQGSAVEHGDRIYTNQVNTTARVEGLAKGDALCISRTFYDNIKNRLSLIYKSLNEHTVLNQDIRDMRHCSTIQGITKRR